METHAHDQRQLFLQLGLPDDADAINRFVASHRLAPGQTLPQAPFWSPVQAAFLSQALAEDSDWSEVVDELAVRLS